MKGSGSKADIPGAAGSQTSAREGTGVWQVQA